MHPAQIFGELIAGWIFADLVTGAFHWWEDRLARPDMPIIGKWLIEANRLHHEEPMVFTTGSLAHRSMAGALVAMVIGGVWILLFGLSVFAIAMTIGGALVNEVHRLAHLGKQPGVLGALQEIGLIQSPAQHAAHHRGTFDRRYCILTDWLNPLLDRAGVWFRLERAIGVSKVEGELS